MPKKKIRIARTLPVAIFGLTLILSVLGLLFVFESSVAESFQTFNDPYFLLRQQVVGFALGLIALGISSVIPSQWWIKLGPIWFLLGIIALISVFLPGVGREFNGAHRWISMGSLRFQPVEFFKIALIFYFASWLPKNQHLKPLLFILSIPSLLLLLQPDLGSLLLVISIGVGMFFVAGGSFKKILLLAILGIPLVLLSIISSPYRLNRLTTFVNPESDPLGASFHIRQITLALGRGGLFGQGIGNSHQKFYYIPEVSTDSIFAVIAEEVGFVGSLGVILLFGLFFWAAYKAISLPTLTPQVRLLSSGLLLWIGLQVILNLSAVVALVPLTGVPLPFFSYGRSSLIMILFGTGILINIAKEN